MTPVLFASNASAFDTNGIGFLSDAISCYVSEERNGAYELELVYPVEGQWASSIGLRSLIKAKPHPPNKYDETYRTDPDDNLEMFRVYRITKPMDGIFTIKARHISYDMSGIPITPFSCTGTAGKPVVVCPAIVSHAATTCPFSFYLDPAYSLLTGDFVVNEPASMRSLILGSKTSLLSVYGGEVLFMTDVRLNTSKAYLQTSRGESNKAVIRYGKNLTDLEQDLSAEKMISGVYGYWYDESSSTYVTSGVVPVSSSITYSNVVVVDFSADFDTAPSQSQLEAAAQSYISSSGYGNIVETITVKFCDLSKYTDSEGAQYLERVNLCDTVKVYYEKFNITAEMKCVAVNYDVLLEQYESIELGTKSRNIVDTIFDIQGKK